MQENTPQPASDYHEEVQSALKQAHSIRWILMGAVTAILIAAVIILGTLLAQASSRISASCGFYKDLAPLPVTVPKGAARPAIVGVRLIADARNTFIGEGCMGPLPQADPSLERWVRFYHVPLDG